MGEKQMNASITWMMVLSVKQVVKVKAWRITCKVNTFNETLKSSKWKTDKTMFWSPESHPTIFQLWIASSFSYTYPLFLSKSNFLNSALKSSMQQALHIFYPYSESFASPIPRSAEASSMWCTRMPWRAIGISPINIFACIHLAIPILFHWLLLFRCLNVAFLFQFFPHTDLCQFLML